MGRLSRIHPVLFLPTLFFTGVAAANAVGSAVNHRGSWADGVFLMLCCLPSIIHRRRAYRALGILTGCGCLYLMLAVMAHKAAGTSITTLSETVSVFIVLGLALCLAAMYVFADAIAVRFSQRKKTALSNR